MEISTYTDINNIDFSRYTRAKWNHSRKCDVKANHLGNVLTTISDRLLPASDSVIAMGANSYDTVKYFKSETVSVNDYYPFGMLEPVVFQIITL